MKSILVYLSCSFLLLWGLPSIGQSVQLKKWRIEAGLGLNGTGPMKALAKHMKQEGFDHDTGGWIFPISHNPQSSNRGFTFLIKPSYQINPNFRIGIKGLYTTLGYAKGYSPDKGYIRIVANNFSISPLIEWMDTNDKASLQIGPSVLINRWVNDHWAFEENGWEESQTRLSIGVHFGGAIHIWNGKNTFGNLTIFYLWTYPQEFGPFSSEFKTDDTALSATDLKFHSLQFTFSMGWKWQ